MDYREDEDHPCKVSWEEVRAWQLDRTTYLAKDQICDRCEQIGDPAKQSPAQHYGFCSAHWRALRESDRRLVRGDDAHVPPWVEREQRETREINELEALLTLEAVDRELGELPGGGR